MPKNGLNNLKRNKMTSNEFNKKYKEYLGDRHYGLDIEVPQLTLWLDEKFQEFIKIPEFKYYQIKTKFGYGRFYCDGVPQEQITEVEEKIRELCK